MITGMCYWRFKGERAWRFGYCTYKDSGLYRMGTYAGDTSGGVLVEAHDEEQKRYKP